MKRFILLLSLCILMCGCGESASSAQPAPKVSPTASPPHFYKVGETVTVQPWEITLQSATIADPAKYPQHDQIFPGLKPTDRFLVLDEHIKNVSSKLQDIAGMQFGLEDKDGNSNYGVQLGLPDVQGVGIGGDVSPTMQQSSQQAYIVPNTVHTFYWSYTATDHTAQVMWEIDV
jgi:hypothetical protein